MNRKITILFCVIISIFITGCRITGTLISPVVLQTFVKEDEEPKSYYSKEKIGVIYDSKQNPYTIIEKWVKKTENGYVFKQSIMHDKNEGFITVYKDGIENIKSITPNGETKYSSNIMNENYVEAMLTSEKNIFLNEVSNLAETHNMNIIGNEKIAGKDTLHIEYDLKDTETVQKTGNVISSYSQYKRIELWVDKNNYKIMKSIRSLPDDTGVTHIRETLEYDDKIDIPDSVFEMEIPETVKLDKNVLSNDISKEKLVANFGNDILYHDPKEPITVSYNYTEMILGYFENYVTIEATYKDKDKLLYKIIINKPLLYEYPPDLKGDDSSTIINKTKVTYIKNRNMVNFQYNDFDYRILSYYHNLNRDGLYSIASDLLEGKNEAGNN